MDKNKVVIDVEDVAMKFNLGQEKTDNFKEFVIKALKKELLFQPFWALKGVSFKIHKGEKVVKIFSLMDLFLDTLNNICMISMMK